MPIDITDPQDLEALMVRVHARRVAAIRQGMGEPVPSGTVTVIATDTGERIREDNEAYLAWCQLHDVECVLWEKGEHHIWDGAPVEYPEVKRADCQ